MTMIVSGSDGLEFPDGSDQTSAFTGNAATITSGTIATARLATGTANSSTYLRGDQTWATVSSSQWVTSGSNISYTTGNVGIGTTSPDFSTFNTSANGLVIKSSNTYGLIKLGGATGDFYIGSGSSSAAWLWNVSNAEMRFGTNNAERMRVDSSGRVIVGYTASVGTAFQTNMQVKGGGTAATYAGYGLITSNNESAGLFGVYSNGENSLWIASDPDNLRPGSRIVFSVDTVDQASIASGGNFAFNSGYGSVATAYGCRAWVNFGSDGTIRASGNVSSVTRNTTGDFTINFTNAMPDTNYSAAMSMRRGATNDVLFACPFGVSSGTAFSTGSLRIRVFNQTPSAENPETGCVQIFR